MLKRKVSKGLVIGRFSKFLVAKAFNGHRKHLEKGVFRSYEAKAEVLLSRASVVKRPCRFPVSELSSTRMC